MGIVTEAGVSLMRKKASPASSPVLTRPSPASFNQVHVFCRVSFVSRSERATLFVPVVIKGKGMKRQSKEKRKQQKREASQQPRYTC